MASSYDEEMARLHQVIAGLKRQNAVLRGMLTDAIDLAGVAIKLDAASEDADEHWAPADDVADDDDDDVADDIEPSSFRTLFKTR
jgi:hypothetical protein